MQTDTPALAGYIGYYPATLTAPNLIPGAVANVPPVNVPRIIGIASQVYANFDDRAGVVAGFVKTGRRLRRNYPFC